MLVAEVLGTQQPVTLPPTATAVTAARMMRDRSIGDVLVVDDDGGLVGIVTDRDLAVRVLADGSDPGDVTLGHVCSPDPVTVESMASTEEAELLMRSHALRRLPVVADGGRKLHGVVTIGDLAQQVDRKSALAEISKAPANN